MERFHLASHVLLPPAAIQDRTGVESAALNLAEETENLMCNESIRGIRVVDDGTRPLPHGAVLIERFFDKAASSLSPPLLWLAAQAALRLATYFQPYSANILKSFKY